jgi:hypothetical protein
MYYYSKEKLSGRDVPTLVRNQIGASHSHLIE